MITKEQALAAIEDMDDFARMADIEPIGAYNTLRQYVEQTENLLDRKDKLIVELQAVERAIQHKIKDLYYISNLKQ